MEGGVLGEVSLILMPSGTLSNLGDVGRISELPFPEVETLSVEILYVLSNLGVRPSYVSSCIPSAFKIRF